MEGQTMNHHPFRFGVQMWETQSAAEWQEKARKAERLGYDILVIPDHFPDPSGGILGYAPALAAAAAATTTLRIGTNVLDQPFLVWPGARCAMTWMGNVSGRTDAIGTRW